LSSSEELPPLAEKLDLSVIERQSETDLPAPQDIDIAFFSHRGRKSTQLIGNTESSNFIKARREWMEFDFVDLIYISTIEVFAFGYDDYHELELSYQDFLTKSTNIEKVRYNGSSFVFKVNRFLGGFGLRPNERWYKDSKLTSINLMGVEQRHFSDVISVLENLVGEKSKIEAHLNQYLVRARAAEKEFPVLTEEIEDLTASISNYNDELLSIKSIIDSDKKEIDNLRKEIAISESVKRGTDEQVQISNTSREKLNNDNERLAVDISEKENKLRSLENNINLFPTEIAGYVEHGAKNVNLYAIISLIPLLVIVIVTFRLFINSEKLLGYIYSPHFGILEFLISRLPYVLVSGLILAVSYTLLHRLITEIIGINRRRQDLFKVSIIATDISYASQDGMELSNEERYNLRTETKMELLKEHLRQHIGEEYVYKPKHNLIHKISTALSRNIADDDKADEPAKNV